MFYEIGLNGNCVSPFHWRIQDLKLEVGVGGVGQVGPIRLKGLRANSSDKRKKKRRLASSLAEGGTF